MQACALKEMILDELQIAMQQPQTLVCRAWIVKIITLQVVLN